MGSYRFMFAFATSLAIQSFTLLAVSALGDTAEAWRTVAIVYAIIGLIVNTLSVFSVKELPEEEFVDTTDKAEIEKDEKYGLVEAAKLLVSNKYYLMICVTYILQQIYGAMISMGTFYTAHTQMPWQNTHSRYPTYRRRYSRRSDPSYRRCFPQQKKTLPWKKQCCRLPVRPSLMQQSCRMLPKKA